MNSDKVFFKIIIPNYNSIAYLPQCLDSILSQTFKDYKIILVDDQSTDFSYKMTKMYERKHPDKIIAIQAETKRYGGGCRNIGIDYPIDCEYMMFIDADDLLFSNDALEAIYNSVRVDRPEVLLFKYADYENNQVYQPPNYFSPDQVIKNGNALGYRYNAIWTKAIRNDKKVKCLENCMHGEDTYVWAKILANKYQLKFLNKTIIKYRHAHNSVTTQKNGLYQSTEHTYKNGMYELFRSVSDNNLRRSIGKIIFTPQFMQEGINGQVPAIYDVDKTLDELIKTDKSFIRFGDGEFELMRGINNVFEKSNSELSTKLNTIVHSNDNNIMVGIPRCYFYAEPDVLQQVGSWLDNYRTIFKKANGLRFFDKNITYYDSYTTIQYKEYRDDRVDFNKYFEKIKTIFKDKEVIVATGDKRLKDFQHDIFSYAKNVTWYAIDCPKNAYAKRQQIYDYLAANGKGKLVVMVFGPAGKAIGYDLIKNENIRIIDCGHLFKTYDLFVKKIDKTQQVNFWCN